LILFSDIGIIFDKELFLSDLFKEEFDSSNNFKDCKIKSRDSIKLTLTSSNPTISSKNFCFFLFVEKLNKLKKKKIYLISCK
jgi:hypothetical protein